MEPPTGQFEICKICFQKADGVHFSTTSCRACAAFFRRTVILKLVYKCRENDQCRVEKAHRNMCRSCRFKRCLKEGMKSKGVQFQRDSIGNSRQKSSLKTKDSASSYNVSTSLNEVFKKSEKENENFEINETPILKQMIAGYDHFMKIRKATSSLLNENLISFMFKNQKFELHASKFDSAKQVCQAEAHLITDIVNTYYIPFNTLKYEDKIAFFKNFFCYFSHTDRAYQSFKTFELDDENDKILMPDGGFIKRNELDKFYENAQGVHTTPDYAAKIFQPALDYILDVIVDHMRTIKISKIEYLAILGFCLWDDAVTGLSNEAKLVARETQSKILFELQQVYSNQRLASELVCNRVGQLLLLIPKLTKCVIMLRENSVLAELFNYYEADVCCKNFKGISSTLNVECNQSCIVHTRNQK